MKKHGEMGGPVNLGQRSRLTIAVSTTVVLFGMAGSMPFGFAQDAGKLPVPGTSDLLRVEPFDRLAEGARLLERRPLSGHGGAPRRAACR